MMKQNPSEPDSSHVVDWTCRYQQALMNTFGPPKTVWVRGEGMYLWDADGRRYLDLLGGIAVNALGYSPAPLVQTLQQQLTQLMHVSNFFATPSQIEAAEAIKAICAPEAWPTELCQKVQVEGRVFFCNSGTEANEAAIKLALARYRQRQTDTCPSQTGNAQRQSSGRKSLDSAASNRMGQCNQVAKNQANRELSPQESTCPAPRIIALEHAFHGRSLGALSLTYKAAYRQAYQDFLGPVQFVPPTPQALSEAMGPDVAAIFIEPIQGEAGVLPVTDQTMIKARQLCDHYGAVLVFDEVQTGIGRCGSWLAHQQVKDHLGQPVVPDVVTLAKGLGSGVPVGACVALNQKCAQALSPGQHGSTFGGGPLVTAAVKQTLTTIKETGLITAVERYGKQLQEGILALNSPEVKTVRGRGYLVGIELHHPWAASVTQRLFERGIIVNAANPSTVRLAPPLIWTPDGFAEFLLPFQDVLSQLNEEQKQ